MFISAPPCPLRCALALLFAAPLLHAQSTFTTNAGDTLNWGDPGNWTPAVPDGAGAQAIFLTPSGAQTISDFGANRTVGSLSITNDSAFPIAFTASQSLTFTPASGNAALTVGGSGDTTVQLTAPIVLGGNLDLHVSNSASSANTGALVFAGNISGPGRIIKTGSGTAGIGGGTYTYTGGIAILEGTVWMDSNGIGFGQIPAAYVPDQILIDGGRLEFESYATGSFSSGPARGVYFGENGAEIASTGTRLLILQGPATGPGHLTKTGSGPLSLNANSSFTGGITIQEGILRLGTANSMGAGPVQLGVPGGPDAALHAALANNNHSNPITVVGGSEGKLSLAGVSTASFNTIFSGPIQVDGDLEISSVSPTGNRLSFTGSLSGTGNITKVGPGQWRLFAANSWTGDLTILEGSVATDSSGDLCFALQDGGITNTVSGPGELVMEGAVSLNRAGVTSAGSWQLWDPATLTVTYTSSFGVRFAEDISRMEHLGGGVYQLGNWSFDRNTATVTYEPGPLTPLTPVEVVIDPLGATVDVPWTVHQESLSYWTEPSGRGGADTLGGYLNLGDEIFGDYFIVEETDEEWVRFEQDGTYYWARRFGLSRSHPDNLSNIALYGDLPIGQEKINRWWGMPLDYEASDIVPVPSEYAMNASTSMRLRQEALTTFMAMADAADLDGIGVWISSSYRSGQTQMNLWVPRTTANPAQRGTAPPGHSEHQLGTTVDLVRTATGGSLRNTDETYLWLAENAHRFGWRQSYTAENIPETGYIEEPWHWRYMGVALYDVVAEVIPVEGGIVTGEGTYPSGDVVTLEAIPAPGYSFAGWEGDVSGTDNPLTFTVTSNKTVRAVFIDAFEAGRIAGRQEVQANPAAFGLYTSDSIQDLRMGGLMLEAGLDGVAVEFLLESSTDLHSWQSVEAIQRLFELSGDRHFLRVRIQGMPDEPPPSSPAP